MKPKKLFLLAFLFMLPGSAAGQKSDSDPFEKYLFPPELVMQNQQAIGLTEEQKSFIKSEILKVTARFTELQWAMQEQAEKFASVLKEHSIDEQQAMAHLDRMLEIEREIKRLQISLVIHIKNKLTPEQQLKLRATRELFDAMKKYDELKKSYDELKKKPEQD